MDKTNIIDKLEIKLTNNFSDTTKKLYLNLFYKIHFQISPKSKNIRFLYRVDDVMQYLEDHYSAKSRRTYLGYIVGIMKIIKDDVHQKKKHIQTLQKYKDLLKETAPKKVVEVVEDVEEEKTE